METMDASTFASLIVRFGLVSEAELAEVYEEIGRNPELPALIAALERKGYLTPWQRAKVLKGDTDGYILGGYRLLYKIQSGSFGRVYRADDPRTSQIVAVKVLRRRWSEDQQRIDLFIREGKVGLMLKHPNIVEVLAINRDPASGSYYLVMEFVEGGNLREILQIRKKLSVAESLRVVDDCAKGLAHAYARHMTHRDIKLTNILISDNREAKLVDFGLAQFFSGLARDEDEKVDRTVDYAGLEKATGVQTGDVRSDIYFLGCVLYECLTGRSPITMTRDKHARMRKGRFEEVQPIHRDEIDGPPSVLTLVETMMALDPKQRYQTPTQLMEAIRTHRRDVDGKSGGGDGRPVPRSVFVAEADERLQDVLRDALKEQGYRVFLAGDPLRALDRFRQHPYDGLLVDARTTGDEGIRVFQHIIEEADRKHLTCAALLLLGEEHASWAERLPKSPHVGFLNTHITIKSVSRKLKELMEAAHGPMALPPAESETQPLTAAEGEFDIEPREASVAARRDESMVAGLPAAFSPSSDGMAASPHHPPRRRPMAIPPPAHGSLPDSLPPSHAHSWRQEIEPPKRREKKEKKKNNAPNKLVQLWTKLSVKQKAAVAIAPLVVLLLVGIVLLNLPGAIVENEIDQIQLEWTEAEVVEALGGAQGEDITPHAKGGQGANAGVTIKRWKLANGKTLDVTFNHDKVTQKMVK